MEEFKETRRDLADAMNKGQCVAFDIDDQVSNLNEFGHPELFPVSMLLNRDQWRAGYKAAIDRGHQKGGHVFNEMADHFMVVIVSKATSEATLMKQMKMVPGIENMNKVIVI